MRTIINFLKEKWAIIVCALMLAVSGVFYLHSELILAQRIIFWVTLGLSAVTVVFTYIHENETEITIAWLTTGLYFLMLSIIWYLPISMYWVLIQIFITGWIHCKLMDNLEVSGFVISIISSSVCVSGLTENTKNIEKNEFLSKATPETVVIEYIDKTIKSDIRVYILEKGILSFANGCKETEDAWKLNNGDTVQIVIYDNKISKLIY